jgi:hypothetical protein
MPMADADAPAPTRERGLDAVLETAGMVPGPAPTVELDRVYGVTTFELG